MGTPASVKRHLDVRSTLTVKREVVRAFVMSPPVNVMKMPYAWPATNAELGASAKTWPVLMHAPSEAALETKTVTL